MSDDARKQTLEVAQALERRGQTDAAAQAFLRAGAVDDALRVLTAAGRNTDAAALLLNLVGVPVDQMGTVDAQRRRYAQRAAILLARAGQPREAAEILAALQDWERAAEVLERAGDPVSAGRMRAKANAGRTALLAMPQLPKQDSGALQISSGAASLDAAQRLEKAGQLDAALEAYVRLRAYAEAARLAFQLGRFQDAGKLFEDGGAPYEAAVAWLRAGDKAHCLDALVRVPRDHPKYRASAVQAIRLSAELNRLDFALDQFLSRFIREGVQQEAELEPFYLLARLYEAFDYPDNAADVYQRVLTARPGYKDAAARAQALADEARGSRMVFEKIVREEQDFERKTSGAAPMPKGAGGLPDLPDLPDLPPRPPSPSAPRSTMAATPEQKARMAQPSSSGRSSQVTDAPTPTGGGSGTAGDGFGLAGRDLDPGTVVGQRYRVEKKLGQGGMAAVYKVHDLELDEDIALKLFGLDADDGNMLGRFKQEVLLSRQLSHTNVIRLHDIGSHEGRKFITMELLEGMDLAALIRGPMDVPRAIRILLQACAGLQAAHERGVVHRDIKPENFFVTRDGVVKLMDFGIAKRKSTSSGMTVAGFIAGTPMYMSPEQIQDFGSVTHLTDIYALGAMAYELLTGSPPFQATELMALLMLHLTREPEPPETKNPKVPQELSQLVVRMLAKKPEERPQSCREIARSLQAVLQTYGR